MYIFKENTCWAKCQMYRRSRVAAPTAQKDSHEGHFCAGFGVAAPVSPATTPARKLGTCSFLRKYEHVPNFRDHECPFYQVISNVPSVRRQ